MNGFSRNVFVWALIGFLTQMAVSVQAAEPIAMGSHLEPLVDEFLIESLHGAALTLHPRVAREVAVVHDQPWEGNACCYHTVFRDGDRCRMAGQPIRLRIVLKDADLYAIQFP